MVSVALSMNFEVYAWVSYADPYKNHDKALKDTELYDSLGYSCAIVITTMV